MAGIEEGLLGDDFKLEVFTTDSPAVATEVKKVTQFQAGSVTRAQIDMTGTRDAAKVFRPGKPDYGTWNVTVIFLPNDAGQQLCYANAGSGEALDWRVTYEDGTVETFSGFVIEEGRSSGGIDSRIDRTFQIKMTGLPNLDPATP